MKIKIYTLLAIPFLFLSVGQNTQAQNIQACDSTCFVPSDLLLNAPPLKNNNSGYTPPPPPRVPVCRWNWVGTAGPGSDIQTQTNTPAFPMVGGTLPTGVYDPQDAQGNTLDPASYKNQRFKSNGYSRYIGPGRGYVNMPNNYKISLEQCS